MANLYHLLRPLLMALPPEAAHRLTIRAVKAGFADPRHAPDDPILATKVFGLHFANPIGLAAGFDKNAEVPDAMLGFGFGFVEVGTVTPRGQPGNAKPRIFRLTEDEGVINRLGFNSTGMEAARARLAARRNTSTVVGINVGANKDTTDRTADYAQCIEALGPFASYLVINVSSPNTPGLRALQSRDALDQLVGRAIEARNRTSSGPPLLVKIAPDLTEEDIADIAAVAVNSAVDGLIVSNTTIARPEGLASRHAAEPGGLSGRPLFQLSTRVLRDVHRATEGKLPLIGVGGVAGGRDAYAKIRAGASLVQLYTALIYRGPGLVGRIKRELAELIRADGFASIADAVGADHPPRRHVLKGRDK